MSGERIKLEMSTLDMFMALSEGNPGALNVLMQLMKGQHGFMHVLMCDTKRLYGSRIWMLYKDICGENIERMRYHLCVELPNQETGQLSVTGPMSPMCRFEPPEEKLFWESRKNGKPGSFWALANPPGRDYAFPLNADGTELLPPAPVAMVETAAPATIEAA